MTPKSASKTALSETRRYERKYVFPASSRQACREIIRRMPGRLTEAYPERWVNSLYWDSVGHQDYQANIDGLGVRSKMRLRWYGALWGNIKDVHLEKKIRHGDVGFKEVLPFGELSLLKTSRYLDLRTFMASSQLPEAERVALAGRRPALLVRYRRAYFSSFGGAVRATLDDEMDFFRWSDSGGFSLNTAKTSDIVLELKYPVAEVSAGSRASAAISARLARHSKYTRGVEFTRPFF